MSCPLPQSTAFSEEGKKKESKASNRRAVEKTRFQIAKKTRAPITDSANVCAPEKGVSLARRVAAKEVKPSNPSEAWRRRESIALLAAHDRFNCLTGFTTDGKKNCAMRESIAQSVKGANGKIKIKIKIK
jgi:hypothetical protein